MKPSPVKGLRGSGGGEGLIEMGVLFNLEKTTVSVIHKELGYNAKWKNSNTRRVEVMQRRIRIKTIPDQSVID